MIIEYKPASLKGLDDRLEKDVEKYLHRKITTLGGTTRKWSSPNHRGVPDRLVFMPSGKLHVVEVKRLSGKPTPLQLKELRALSGLGFKTAIVYGHEGVDEFIRSLDLPDAGS